MTRRLALQLTGGAAGVSFVPLLRPQVATATVPSSKRATFFPDLVSYSSEHLASFAAKLHKQTMQPEDFLNVASQANLIARHLESTGIDSKLKNYFAQMSQNGTANSAPSGTQPASDATSAKALARMQKYDPSINASILSSLPQGDPAETARFLATNGIAGLFRRSASLFTSAGPALAEKQIQATASPVGFRLNGDSGLSMRGFAESPEFRPAAYEMSDGVWRGSAHLEHTCYVKPSGVIHFNLCTAASGLAGLGVDQIRDWLKDNPEALAELAAFMEVAPEAVLIMGVLLIATFILIAATC